MNNKFGKGIEEPTVNTLKRGRPPKRPDERKAPVSLRLSQDVLAWLREGGPGWQARLEEILRSKMVAAEPPNS
jgi:uncharacterized protein (DUF4415 family)